MSTAKYRLDECFLRHASEGNTCISNPVGFVIALTINLCAAPEADVACIATRVWNEYYEALWGPKEDGKQWHTW